MYAKMNPTSCSCSTPSLTHRLLIVITASVLTRDALAHYHHRNRPQDDNHQDLLTRHNQRLRRDADSFEERFAALSQQLKQRPKVDDRDDALKRLTFEDLFADSSGYSKQLKVFEEQKGSKNKKGHQSNQLFKGFHQDDHNKHKKKSHHSKHGKKSTGGEHKHYHKHQNHQQARGHKSNKKRKDKHENKGDKQKGFKKQLKKDENDRKKIFYDESDHQEYHIEYDSHDEYFDKHDQKNYKGDAEKALKEHDAHGEKGHSDSSKKHHHKAADAKNYGLEEHEDHHKSYEGKKGHKEAKGHSSGHRGGEHHHHGKGSHSAPKLVKTIKGTLKDVSPGVSAQVVSPLSARAHASLQQGSAHDISKPTYIQQQSPHQLQHIQQEPLKKQQKHHHRHKLSPEQIQQVQLLHQYQLQQLQLQQQQQHLLQQHQHEEHERLRQNRQRDQKVQQTKSVPIPVVIYQPGARPAFEQTSKNQGRGPNNPLTPSSTILHFEDGKSMPLKNEVNTYSRQVRAPTPMPVKISTFRLLSGFKQSENDQSPLQEMLNNTTRTAPVSLGKDNIQREAQAGAHDDTITPESSNRLTNPIRSKTLSAEPLLHLTEEDSGGYGQKLAEHTENRNGSRNASSNSTEFSGINSLSHNSYGKHINSNKLIDPKIRDKATENTKKTTPNALVSALPHPIPKAPVYHQEIHVNSDQEISTMLHNPKALNAVPPKIGESRTAGVVAKLAEQHSTHPPVLETGKHCKNSNGNCDSTSHSIFVNVFPEKNAVLKDELTTVSDRNKMVMSSKTGNYSLDASVEEMKNRDDELIRKNLKIIASPDFKSNPNVQQQRPSKTQSLISEKQAGNQGQSLLAPRQNINSSQIISVLSQMLPIQLEKEKTRKKLDPVQNQSASAKLRSTVLLQEPSPILQQVPRTQQYTPVILLPSPAQQLLLNSTSKQQPNSDGNQQPLLQLHQPQQIYINQQHQIPPQQPQPQQQLLLQQQQKSLPQAHTQHNQPHVGVEAAVPSTNKMDPSVTGIWVQPKGLSSDEVAELTPDRSQQVSLVVHADQLHPASASGHGGGKDYHKSSAAKKQLHEEEGQKKSQGAKEAEGYKKDHHKTHDKEKHKKFIDKGGHKHHQKQHQKSYEGHYKKGKKGKKGFKRGSKKISKKGHSDSGMNEHREKKVYAKKKKYYDEKDLEKHFQSHEDFDSLFDKHKKGYDKSGMFSSMNHDESFGAKRKHDHKSSHGHHKDHKKDDGKKNFFTYIYKHRSKKNHHTPRSSHDHFSNEVHHESGGHHLHDHGFSDFDDDHHELSGSDKIESIIKKMNG